MGTFPLSAGTFWSIVHYATAKRHRANFKTKVVASFKGSREKKSASFSLCVSRYLEYCWDGYIRLQGRNDVFLHLQVCFSQVLFRNNFSRVEIIFMGVILQYFHGKTLSSTGGFREIFHGQDRLFKGVKLNIFTGGVFFFFTGKKKHCITIMLQGHNYRSLPCSRGDWEIGCKL